MGKVVITIETDNAAFEDAFEYEVAKVLAQVPQKLDEDGAKLRDTNGNTVGEVRVYGE